MEFLELSQGNSSLTDYIAKFQSLEPYCPNLFADDRERAGKFIRGLKEGLMYRVLTSMPSTFSAAVAAATLLSEAWERTKSTQSRKPPAAGGEPKTPSGDPGKRPFFPVKIEGGKKQFPPSKASAASGQPSSQAAGWQCMPQMPTISHWAGVPAMTQADACIVARWATTFRDCRKKAADDFRQNSGAPLLPRPPQPQQQYQTPQPQASGQKEGAGTRLHRHGRAVDQGRPSARYPFCR